MDAAATRSALLIAHLPAWIGPVVEYNDSYRFEALGLLEEAKTKLTELKAKPPADSAAAASAALHPLHLALKALLAARAVKSLSTQASLAVAQTLYEDRVPAGLLETFTDVQGMKIQGGKAIEAAERFTEAVSKLLA